MRKLSIYIVCFFAVLNSFSQSDTIKHKDKKLKVTLSGDTSSFFTGTRIADKEDTSEYHHITIGGAVSSYYAHYSDENNIGGFVQFPTMGARNDNFGLNVAQLSMTYRSRRVRSNVTLHYGDIAESTWPKTFNVIQEAHAGIKLIKHLWLDAGFFRTHIGLESARPHENVTSSMAVLTFYEPYFFGGVKLTYEITPKLTVQLNAFNGYNTFIDDNKSKAYGFSAVYDPNDRISITYNFLTCDETPLGMSQKHQRYFNNVYATFKLGRFSLGIEGNYAWQEHSLLTDTTKSAAMISGLVVGRMQLLKKLAVYGRGEYFSDPNRTLTGALDIGKEIYGGTLGLEFHPLKNASISAETRLLQSTNFIFREGSVYSNQRSEYSITMDIWF